MPKCAAERRIFGWPSSLPAAGTRHAAASSSETVTSMMSLQVRQRRGCSRAPCGHLCRAPRRASSSRTSSSPVVGSNVSSRSDLPQSLMSYMISSVVSISYDGPYVKRLIARTHRERRRRGQVAAGTRTTSIQEITDAADIGFGSFYNHVDTKDQLFQTASAEVLERWGQMIDHACAGMSFDEPADPERPGDLVDEGGDRAVEADPVTASRADRLRSWPKLPATGWTDGRPAPVLRSSRRPAVCSPRAIRDGWAPRRAPTRPRAGS